MGLAGREWTRAFLLTGIPFGLVMGAFFAVRFGWVLGLRTGVLSGVSFGAAMAAFLAWQRGRRASTLVGETSTHDGPANHLRGLEGVGGWLYLTETRLLFRPHRFNVQKDELSISIEHITAVRPRQTALIIPNGLEVATATGVERFVVQGRAEWVDAISRRRRLGEAG